MCVPLTVGVEGVDGWPEGQSRSTAGRETTMPRMNNEQLWSVEIVTGHYERAAIDYAGTRVVDPDDYMVVRPWEDGPSTVHIEGSCLPPVSDGG